MKWIFIILMISSNCFALTGEDLMNSAKQFQNRNWSYHSAGMARRAHLKDFTDVTLIGDAQTEFRKFLSSINNISNSDVSLFSKFYPELEIGNYSQIIGLRNQWLKTIESYEILKGWKSFLDAINKERWSDPDVALCKTAVNKAESDHCGRGSAGNYAIQNLTYYQRTSLSSFKDIVIEELNQLKQDKLNTAAGPGLARVFQFLIDGRAIPALVQIPYVSMDDPNDPNLRRTNIIDIARALIIQTFQESNSSKLTNIDNREILLEGNGCSNSSVCNLDYFKELIWNGDYSEEAHITNLILDPKPIKPIANSLIQHFKNDPSFSYEKLYTFVIEAYLALMIAYDIEDTESPDISVKFKGDFVRQLKIGMDYLINKRDIVGLQIARGMQELVLFIEKPEDANEE